MVKVPSALYGAFDNDLGIDWGNSSDDDQEYSEDLDEGGRNRQQSMSGLEDVVNHINSDLRNILSGLISESSGHLQPVTQESALRVLAHDKGVNTQNLKNRIRTIRTREMVSRSRESDGFEDFHIPDEDLQVLQDQLWGDDVDLPLPGDRSDSESNGSDIQLPGGSPDVQVTRPPQRSPERLEPVSRFERRLRSIERFGKDDWEDMTFSNAFDSELSDNDSEDDFVQHAEKVLFDSKGGLLSRQSSAYSIDIPVINITDLTLPNSPSSAEISERVTNLSKKVGIHKRNQKGILKPVNIARIATEKRGSDVSISKMTPRRTLNLQDYEEVLSFKDAGLVYESGEIAQELSKARHDLQKLKERWLRLQAEEESAAVSENKFLLDRIQMRAKKYMTLSKEHDASASHRERYNSAESLYSIALRAQNLISAMDTNRRVFQQQLTLEMQGDRAARIEWLVTKSETKYIIE